MKLNDYDFVERKDGWWEIWHDDKVSSGTYRSKTEAHYSLVSGNVLFIYEVTK